MKKNKIFDVFLSMVMAFSITAIPTFAQGSSIANGIQKAYIVAEDWGPVVKKTVINLDKKVANNSVGDESNEFTIVETKRTLTPSWTVAIASAQRTVLDAYTSDETGNRISEDSNYITIDMYVSPTMTGEGAAFVYSGYNRWCDPYQLDIQLNGELQTTDGETIDELNVDKDIDLEGEGKICPEVNKFQSGIFNASDGRTLPYAAYEPAKDSKTNALVIWLHGAGEGGTNPEIAYLGNKVTSLISDEFQSNFGGAYVLVPQCPEGYGWPVDENGNYTTGATPSRWRTSLFELINTYVNEHPDIDSNRIIVGGCSNGGNMVYDLVLSHMGYFAAAFPMCHEYNINNATDEQLEYLKDFPVWSTYTLGDSSSYIGSIPIVRKMQEIGATAFHYSEFQNASDVTGRFFGNPSNPTVLDTTGTSTVPLRYDGHWAWTLFFENQCRDGDLTAWQWLAQQSKASETNKKALSIAVEVANNVSEEELDKVVPAVVNEFKAALQEAQTLLADAAATQEAVDTSFNRLAAAIQMLDFIKGDKAALRSFVNNVEDTKAELYTSATWSIFAAALENGQAVLADENAFQDEVDRAYDGLVRAYLGLRLVPNKDLLKELINKANSLNAANYTAETWAVMANALEEANATLANENATAKEVEAAKAALSSAIDGLVANTATDTPVNPSTPDNTVSPNESVSSSVSNSVVKAGESKSIKTGDTASLGYSIAGLALASMVLAANKKRTYLK